MTYRWRFLLSLLGFAFYGLNGALVGFVLGFFLDMYQRQDQKKHSQAIQRVFFDVSFQVMGYLAKSDGRVSEREISTARLIMSQMGLNETMKQEAIRLFTEGKQQEFDIVNAMNRLKRACWRHPSLLKMFLDFQYQMANADDGQISTGKRQAFEHICRLLGVQGFRHNQYHRSRSNQHSGYQQRYGSGQRSCTLSDAYRTLDVTSDATDAEVKKAYRRLMSRNHPDRLIAKGVPPEMIKLATQKTQQIKEAYEKIKAYRGF